MLRSPYQNVRQATTEKKQMMIKKSITRKKGATTTWYGLYCLLCLVYFFLRRTSTRNNLWRLWPLGLVIVGIKMLINKRRCNMIFALFLIVAGVIFMGINFGLFQPEILVNLWRFWPVILIASGIMILGSATSQSGLRPFSEVLFLATLVGVFYWDKIFTAQLLTGLARQKWYISTSLCRSTPKNYH